MTPAKIINQSAADGVVISLSVAGKVKATGIQEHVDKWLPTIREYKMSLIAFLSDAETDASENRADTAVDRNSYILPTIEESETDDRRTCRQCQNMRGRVCGIAKPERWALVVTNVGYRPQPDTPQRCAGYLPNATDNDQRPGRERWPGLTDTKGTK